MRFLIRTVVTVAALWIATPVIEGVGVVSWLISLAIADRTKSDG
jgi:uncharacterized membrane protein YvlD (DUF360 family)